jgi:hypothetical protein
MRNAWRQSKEETRIGSLPARPRRRPGAWTTQRFATGVAGLFPLPGLNQGYEEEIRS